MNNLEVQTFLCCTLKFSSCSAVDTTFQIWQQNKPYKAHLISSDCKITKMCWKNNVDKNLVMVRPNKLWPLSSCWDKMYVIPSIQLIVINFIFHKLTSGISSVVKTSSKGTRTSEHFWVKFLKPCVGWGTLTHSKPKPPSLASKKHLILRSCINCK